MGREAPVARRPTNMLSACLLLALALPVMDAPEDTTAAAIRLSVSPKPEAFYSPARGFGVGGDVRVRNLLGAGSELTVTVVAMSRHGEYGAFLFTDDPREATLFAGGGIYYVGTRAFGFYGLGPRSHVEDALLFTARQVEAEARVGWRPAANLPLTVQPGLRFVRTHMRSFDEQQEGALERMGPSMAAHVSRALEQPSTGVVPSLVLVLDLLDEPRYPRRGTLLQTAVRRYVGIDDDRFGYWQGSVIAHGVLPVIGERTVFQGRIVGTVTRRAGPERDIPFFALPRLDGDLVGGSARNRFIGHDILAVSAGLRFPVLDLLDRVGAEGFVALHLAHAYDDIFGEFVPWVDFRRRVPANNVGVPLRPALTLGGYLVDLRSNLPMVAGQIGLSAEGLQLAGLEFVIDLRTRRPAVR